MTPLVPYLTAPSSCLPLCDPSVFPQVYLKQKKWEDAEEFVQRTLRVDPKNVKALSRRAFVLCETGRAEQALEAIAQVPIYPYIGLYLSLPGPLSILI